MANIIMHMYSKETNLMEISGQGRGLLWQFGDAFRGKPKSQWLKQVREVLKDAVAQEYGGRSLCHSPGLSHIVVRWLLWLQPSSQQKEKATREVWRHLYQENKTFLVIPETFCSLWLKLCHMVTSSCKGGYLAAPNKIKVILTMEKEENVYYVAS